MNLLRTSILFLMLYLIFTQRISVGQFFSLFIYSFFIFGPLQELGNIINIYRETEASLNIIQDILNMPPEEKPANPKPLGVLQSTGVQPSDASSTIRRTGRRYAAWIFICRAATRLLLWDLRGREDNASEIVGWAL